KKETYFIRSIQLCTRGIMIFVRRLLDPEQMGCLYSELKLPLNTPSHSHLPQDGRAIEEIFPSFPSFFFQILEESRRGLEESRRQTRAYDEETSRIQAETRAKKFLIAQIEEQIEELKEQKARRDAQLAQCESTRNEEME
ncbi:unnamed protein product, partial [Rhizoctonia solani]